MRLDAYQSTHKRIGTTHNKPHPKSLSTIEWGGGSLSSDTPTGRSGPTSGGEPPARSVGSLGSLLRLAPLGRSIGSRSVGSLRWLPFRIKFDLSTRHAGVRQHAQGAGKGLRRASAGALRTSDHVVLRAVLCHAQGPAQPKQQTNALSSKRQACGACAGDFTTM